MYYLVKTVKADISESAEGKSVNAVFARCSCQAHRCYACRSSEEITLGTALIQKSITESV